MKTFFILLVSAFPFFAGAQSNDAAVAYNDHIVELQNRIGVKMLALINKVEEEGSTRESVDLFYQDLLLEITKVIKEAEKIEPFEGNANLRNAAINMFRYYEKFVNTDYKRILDILFSNKIDDAMKEEFLKLQTKVSEEEAVYQKAILREQKMFADKYNLGISKRNELQEEFKSQ